VNVCFEEKHQPVKQRAETWEIYAPQRAPGSIPFLGAKKKESERKYREKGQSRRGRTMCYQMPPRRIQRVIRAPGNIRAVCSTRAVLVDIRGAELGLPVQAGERVYVTPPPASMWSVISVHSALEVAYYSRVRIEDVECLSRK
jgi:hypothetical protein